MMWSVDRAEVGIRSGHFLHAPLPSQSKLSKREFSRESMVCSSSNCTGWKVHCVLKDVWQSNPFCQCFLGRADASFQSPSLSSTFYSLFKLTWFCERMRASISMKQYYKSHLSWTTGIMHTQNIYGHNTISHDTNEPSKQSILSWVGGLEICNNLHVFIFSRTNSCHRAVLVSHIMVFQVIDSMDMNFSIDLKQQNHRLSCWTANYIFNKLQSTASNHYPFVQNLNYTAKISKHI
jgi:hypothetical protein